MSSHIIIYIIILIFKKSVFYLVPFSLPCLSPLFPALCPVVSVLEKIINLMTTSDLQPERKQSEGPHPLLCPWNVCSAHSSHTKSHLKDAALRE